MKFTPENISDRIQIAQQQEIRDGEETFIAALSEVLSHEVLRDGVTLDFGVYRSEYENILDLLRVDEGVVGTDERPSIGGGALVYNYGGVSYFGKWLEGYVAKYGVLTTLEQLQSVNWSKAEWGQVRPQQEHTDSRIFMGDDTFSAEFCLRANNYPYVYDEYDNLEDTTFLARNQSDNPQQHMYRIAEHLDDYGLQLRLPEVRYQIGLGKTATSGIGLDYTPHRYLFESGRFRKRLEE